MPSERGVVSEYDVIAHHAVVGHVGADHEQSAIADPGQHSAALGSRVHGRMFADGVVGAYLQAGGLALVFEILRRHSDRRERVNGRARSDGRPSGDDDVRDQSDAVLQDDIGTHGAVRTDENVLPQLRPRLDDRRGVNFRHGG